MLGHGALGEHALGGFDLDAAGTLVCAAVLLYVALGGSPSLGAAVASAPTLVAAVAASLEISAAIAGMPDVKDC